MINGLAGIKQDTGAVVVVCTKCRAIPDNALGAQNRAELVYMLVCPKMQCNAWGLGNGKHLRQKTRNFALFAASVQLLS